MRYEYEYAELCSLDHLKIFYSHKNIQIFIGLLFFSDISERNNDYSDTLDFGRGWVGEAGVVTFFVLKVPGYESAMLIYLYTVLLRM